ncbi:acetyl CoA--N6-hydroxylysine acetyl transferase, partial [Burkholderia cenocepacia]|nr:acetyl CoA--N6-hydroxylysine acetyl transferase [Burkholderia cenocepacia]
MQDTLTKPAGAADAVEGEVAAALDSAARGQAAVVVEHALDAWRPDDAPDALLATFVALFNTDTRHDAATISVPLGGADATAVASYV